MKSRVCPNCGPVDAVEFDPLAPYPQPETCVECGATVEVEA